MYFKIVNPYSLVIEGDYGAESPIRSPHPWSEYPHVAVPEELDPECVKAVSWQETITVIDSPAIPEVPESIDQETGETIPGTPAVEAITHEEQVTRYGVELDPGLVEAKRLREKAQRKAEKVREALDRTNSDLKEAFGADSSTLAVLDIVTLLDMILVPAEHVDASNPDLDTNAKVQAAAKAELKQLRKALKKWKEAKKVLKDELSQEGV